jgi:hypothetical protein
MDLIRRLLFVQIAAMKLMVSSTFEIMVDPIPLEDVDLKPISIHDDLCVEINGQNLYKSVNDIMKRAIYPKKMINIHLS